jgi:hypothetical protein
MKEKEEKEDMAARVKTLTKTLEGMSGKIKIGAEDGSSYFYVGTAEDFRENMDKYEKMDMDYYDNKVNRTKERFEELLNTDTSFSGYAKKQYKAFVLAGSQPNFTMSGYTAYLTQHAKKTSACFSALKEERKRRADRVPLPIREVVEVFEADKVVDDCMVIKISGDEIGTFWTTDEGDGMQLRGEEECI